MPIPQLDTRGINARYGTMEGIQAERTQQTTENLRSRNLLMQDQLENLPQQRQREETMWQRGTEEYEQKKKETELQYRELVKDVKDKDRKRLLDEKKDIAVRLLRVNPGDISTWQKEWDTLTAEKPEMIKDLEAMGLSRDQITPEVHEDLKDMVLGEIRVLSDFEAEKRAELEATKHDYTLKEIKAREKSALRVMEAGGKGAAKKSEKESPILKDLRDRFQSIKSEWRRLKSGVDIIPGMPEDEKQAAIADAEKELKALSSAYSRNGGDVKDLGLDEPKTSAGTTTSGATKRYVYENGKLTLKGSGSGIPTKTKGTRE